MQNKNIPTGAVTDIELDLYFQTWLAHANATPEYSTKLLYEAYRSGISPELFHEIYVELPF